MDQIRDCIGDTGSIVLSLGLASMAIFESVVGFAIRWVKDLKGVDVVVLWIRKATTRRDHKEAFIVQDDFPTETVDELG